MKDSSKLIQANFQLGNNSKLTCVNCMWEGNEDDLRTFTDLSDNDVSHEIQYFKGCPNCETDAYLMNVDDDDEQVGDVFVFDTCEDD